MSQEDNLAFLPGKTTSRGYHSNEGSTSSSASGVSKDQKAEDVSLRNIAKSAQLDRNRLSNMLETYKSSSASDDEFTDADEFISKLPSRAGTAENGEPSNDRFEFELTPPNNNGNKPNETSRVSSDTHHSEESNVNSLKLAISNPNFPADPSPNRASVYSDYNGSIHEVNKIEYVVDTNAQPGNIESVSRKPSVVRVNINSTTTKLRDSETPKDSGTPQESEFQFESSPEPEKVSHGIHSTHYGNFSFDASESGSSDVINPLNTSRINQQPRQSDRSEITGVDPAIPSRSKDRPVSTAFLRPQERDLSSNDQRSKSLDMHSIDILMVELNKEIQNSPYKYETPVKMVESEIEKTEPQASDVAKEAKRPLPPPPVPKHVQHPSLSFGEDQDADYVDETEINEEAREVQMSREVEGETEKPTKKQRKKRSGHHHKRKSTRNDIGRGHFDQETLAQLLQVTEGTIIGQEFQNIGLEPTEKQLIERIVDSLSRLTADMIIDSERHDESVKRLNKAIKALEGF